MSTLTPCLWFDTQALDAANYYISIFPNSHLGSISYYDAEKKQVLVVEFVLDGDKFMGLNGGPIYTHSPAISFVIPCKDQVEVDHYWSALTSDGGQESQCGWVTDRFGVSWQIVPNALRDLMSRDTSGRVMQAMLRMKKIIIADLEEAYNG